MQIQIYLCSSNDFALAENPQSKTNQKGLALLGALQPPYATFTFCYCAPSACGLRNLESGEPTASLFIRNFIKKFQKNY
jgi:hypothetical protein